MLFDVIFWNSTYNYRCVIENSLSIILNILYKAEAKNKTLV